MFNYYNGNDISMNGQKETSSHEAENKRADSLGLRNISVFRGLDHSHVWWKPLDMHDLHG